MSRIEKSLFELQQDFRRLMNLFENLWTNRILVSSKFSTFHSVCLFVCSSVYPFVFHLSVVDSFKDFIFSNFNPLCIIYFAGFLLNFSKTRHFEKIENCYQLPNDLKLKNNFNLQQLIVVLPLAICFELWN